jgi:hypothetical protein
MRGAGCTLNDILDRDIDGSVERTKSRPLPAGTVTLHQAVGWLGVQLAGGLGGEGVPKVIEKVDVETFRSWNDNNN